MGLVIFSHLASQSPSCPRSEDDTSGRRKRTEEAEAKLDNPIWSVNEESKLPFSTGPVGSGILCCRESDMSICEAQSTELSARTQFDEQRPAKQYVTDSVVVNEKSFPKYDKV